jgi:hypothetical protein
MIYEPTGFRGQGISSFVSGVKQAISGQTGYTAPIKAILKSHGNKKIMSINIVRSPVESAITGAMNAFSMGKFGANMEKAGFDKLYHLQADITLANGKKVSVEKIEVVNIRMGKTKKANQEEEMIDNIPDITLQQLMDNCQRQMGANFFTYSASSNNCQDFLLALMKSSGIGNEGDYAFIKQDTEALFRKQGNLKALSNNLTTIGAKLNILTSGGALYQPSKGNRRIRFK